MALKMREIIITCIISIIMKRVAGYVHVKKLEVLNNPNEYFGDITADVTEKDKNSAISVDIPILKNLPEDLEIRINLIFNHIPILKGQKIRLCEAISSDGLFKNIVTRIKPEGFPTKCPIPTGKWKIINYVLDVKDYLPLGITPAGDFEAELQVGSPDKEPFIKIEVFGSVESSISPVEIGSLLSHFKL